TKRNPKRIHIPQSPTYPRIKGFLAFTLRTLCVLTLPNSPNPSTSRKAIYEFPKLTPTKREKHRKTKIHRAGGGGMATTSLDGAGEDRVLATAQQILMSLNTPKEVRQDMLLIFSSFDNRLSTISDLIDADNDSKSTISDAVPADEEEQEDLDRLEAAMKVILRWDASFSGGGDSLRHSTSILDSHVHRVEYFSAVDDIIQWIDENLSLALPLPPRRAAMCDRAEKAIQIAMTRLEHELRHVLIRSTVPLDADSLYSSVHRVSLSLASHDGAAAAEIDGSSESFGKTPNHRFHERVASFEDENENDGVSIDLVHPDAVPELREIVTRMIRSGYERECLQVYSGVRRDALDECLAIIGVERLSIEEVHRVEWKVLDEKMKNWVHAVKISVVVLLSGEKRLCENVFGDLVEVKEVCFNEIAKGCVMQLLNFAEAVSICKRSPEKLFRILDMYEASRDVLPDLEAMVSDEFVAGEARGALSGLGNAVIGTFAEFENCIRNETSKKLVITGDVHPLARYVMNYLKLLVDYSEPLNLLLEIREEDLYRVQNDFRGDVSQIEAISPLGQRTLLLMSELEFNLEEKSRLYEDNALQQIFLMNNLYYLVWKVRDSEIRKVLGDDWIRKRRGQIRQYATGYLRASWTRALACLKDEGIGGSSSLSSASKMALKERFKSFNACFEEIYRIQTAWKVPDDRLREELQLSISEKVIPAYRSFVGRFSSHLVEGRHAGKYIKYTPEDLDTYLLNLFEGSPAVLHHIRRKST
ncbi:hypothetical protein HN51_062648, partial [Arachis hypogaea]